jgi:hypothetical protein
LVAPDPSDPSAPIRIDLIATDKDGGVATRSVTIQVPGTGIPTPIVRDLGIIEAPSLLRAYAITEIPDTRTTIPTAPTTLNDRRFIAQQVSTNERYLELRLVTTFGEDEPTGHRMSLEKLANLPEFLEQLPDGRYRLYLKENDFTLPRLLLDVVVFRGRAVTRVDLQSDRPPQQFRSQPTVVPDVPPVAKTPGPNETSADLTKEEESPADGDGPQLRVPSQGGPGLRGAGGGAGGPGLRNPAPELQELRGRAP